MACSGELGRARDVVGWIVATSLGWYRRSLPPRPCPPTGPFVDGGCTVKTPFGDGGRVRRTGCQPVPRGVPASRQPRLVTVAGPSKHRLVTAARASFGVLLLDAALAGGAATPLRLPSKAVP